MSQIDTGEAIPQGKPYARMRDFAQQWALHGLQQARRGVDRRTLYRWMHDPRVKRARLAMLRYIRQFGNLERAKMTVKLFDLCMGIAADKAQDASVRVQALKMPAEQAKQEPEEPAEPARPSVPLPKVREADEPDKQAGAC